MDTEETFMQKQAYDCKASDCPFLRGGEIGQAQEGGLPGGVQYIKFVLGSVRMKVASLENIITS
jgi:hypothetical protein